MWPHFGAMLCPSAALISARMTCGLAPQFLDELDQLLAVAVDDQERELLGAVHRLGQRCRCDRKFGRLLGVGCCSLA
jgi:hypothetical protein